MWGRSLIMAALVGGAIFSSVALLSCQSREDKEEPSIEQEALNLIKNHQYDEALEKLNLALANNPSDHISQLIASTYAAKAGIFVEDYWDFISAYNTPDLKEQDQDLSQSADYQNLKDILKKLDSSELSKNSQALDELLKNMTTVKIYAQKIEVIPIVSESQEQDIQNGLNVLESTKSPGAKLYGSLLWLILIRKSLSQGIGVWENSVEHLRKIDLLHLNSDANRKIICDIDQNGFVAWIRNLALAISRVADNLLIAYPSKTDDFARAEAWLQPLRKLTLPSGVCP